LGFLLLPLLPPAAILPHAADAGRHDVPGSPRRVYEL